MQYEGRIWECFRQSQKLSAGSCLKGNNGLLTTEPIAYWQALQLVRQCIEYSCGLFVYLLLTEPK